MGLNIITRRILTPVVAPVVPRFRRFFLRRKLVLTVLMHSALEVSKPGVSNRTNRTENQSNSIERLLFDWVRQSYKNGDLITVSSVIEKSNKVKSN